MHMRRMKVFSCFLLALGISLPLRAAAADAPDPQPAADNRADELFRSMDMDNKGFITFEDFQKRYHNMQRPAFDAIDANKDGNISLEEWRAFFQNHGTMGAMPPGRRPPPGHEAGGGMGGTPLILPPAK